jgi:hypothetical protein
MVAQRRVTMTFTFAVFLLAALFAAAALRSSIQDWA